MTAPRPLSFLLCLVGLATAVFLPTAVSGAAAPRATAPAAATTKQAQLRAALEKADRVTIAPTQPDGTRGAIKEQRGALVRDLVNLIEIDEAYGESHPSGPTDAVFSFFAGERPIATISLRRVTYLHWDGGPWVGDAAVTPAAAQDIVRWCRQVSLDITAVLQDQLNRQKTRMTDGIKKFLDHFNSEARLAFGSSDQILYTGRKLRVIEAPLAAAYTDKSAFAEACFRALAEGTQPWLSDDWATGAVETALLDLEPSVVLAAMKRLEGDEKALLGAARFFLRCRFDRKLDAADANAWSSRLADVALRAGRDSDKHTALEFIARIPGDIPATFLRAVVQGTQKYTFTPAYDEFPSNIEEPGLPYTAALLLAVRGDARAAELIRSLRAKNPVAQDLAALEVAAAALDPAVPLKPSHFKYLSHSIGAAAVDVLARRDVGAVPLGVLTAACESQQVDVASDAARIALQHGLTRAPSRISRDNLSLEYDPMLAQTHPARAITEYSALLGAATGETRSRLLQLRAQAYTNQKNYPAAENDYYAAIEADSDSTGAVLSRLAWIQWYLGKLDNAAETVDRVMSVEPSPDLALLRGIMAYSQNNFQRSIDSDFIAVMVMDPSEGYAPLFQHLAATLGGRAEDSRLAQFFLTSGGGVPEWPQQLFAFLLGRLNVNRLFEAARASEPNELAWHLCEANFYASQMARIAGRTDDEQTFLLSCIDTDQPHVAEFWMAKYRLRALGATPGPGRNNNSSGGFTPPGDSLPMPLPPPRNTPAPAAAAEFKKKDPALSAGSLPQYPNNS